MNVFGLARAGLACRPERACLAERGDTRVDGSGRDIPELTAPVNDFAGVIDAASKDQIDALVRQLKNATGDVMVVATIKTFKPYADLPSYAVKMFENHGKGIGAKGKDNGVLIVLAVDDRAGADRTRIRTRGLHHRRIRRRDEPRDGAVLSQRRLRRGTCRGRHARRRANRRGPQCQPRRTARRGQRNRGAARGGLPIGFWVVLFIIVMSMRKRRRRSRWISGVGPFGGGFRRRVRRRWRRRSADLAAAFGGFGGGRSGGGGGGASW